LEFKLNDVTAIEVGFGEAPSTIIMAGNAVTLQTDLELVGTNNHLLAGVVLEVRHHLQNLENGVMTTLPAAPAFTVPTTNPGVPIHLVINSGPYTTGTPASDLPIPAGWGSGTYRVMTHVHPTAPAPPQANRVAAFHDGLILMIVPANAPGGP
jgi:hypothetical protein